MANYYEKARTNYFNVKDSVEFNKFIDLFKSIEIVEEDTGKVAILFDEEIGIPSYYLDENDEDVEVDFVDEIAKHLTDDSIAVFQAVGSEKMRFLIGYAIAVNSKGERVEVNLSEIYDRAKKKFGQEKIIGDASY